MVRSPFAHPLLPPAELPRSRYSPHPRDKHYIATVNNPTSPENICFDGKPHWYRRSIKLVDILLCMIVPCIYVDEREWMQKRCNKCGKEVDVTYMQLWSEQTRHYR